jgi:hypothetical protein
MHPLVNPFLPGHLLVGWCDTSPNDSGEDTSPEQKC